MLQNLQINLCVIKANMTFQLVQLCIIIAISPYLPCYYACCLRWVFYERPVFWLNSTLLTPNHSDNRCVYPHNNCGEFWLVSSNTNHSLSQLFLSFSSLSVICSKHPIFMSLCWRQPRSESSCLLAVYPSVSFSCMQCPMKALREFLQIWHKHPLELKDELIRIWWSKVKG